MAKASLLSHLIYPLSNGFRINTSLVHNHFCYRHLKMERWGVGVKEEKREKEKHLLFL